MKNNHVNLIRFLSALSISSLLLTVSAQLTDSNDVMALGLLQAAFPLMLPSSGDPCLPTPYLWVQCSSDVTPRITALNLNNHFLLTDGRTLPDFSAMDALEIIDFSDNVLQQEFPDFFANFPKLRVLNLANNYLTGTVPTSLRDKSKANTLKLTLTGVGMALCFSDEDTCGTGTPGVGTPGGSGSYTPTPVRSPEKKTTPIVLGTGIPIFVIFWAVVLFLAIDHQKKKALAVAAATGQTNGTPALGTPVYAEDEQPMHPTVKTTV